MKIFRRTLSILLAVCIFASVTIVASAVAKTAPRTGEIKYYQRDASGKIVNDGSGNPIELTTTINYGTRPVVSDVVNSDPGNQVPTRKYRFYMPDSWRNDRNDNYDGNSLDSCCPCVYWWSTSYNCDDYKGDNAKGWPGFRILEQDPDDPHIFVCEIPEDAHTIIFNNSVVGGQTPVNNPNYGYNFQTIEIPTSYTDPEDDPYGFYTTTADGQPISESNPMYFDNMIYVVNPNDTTVSDLSGAFIVHGDWFYYYGDGKYGISPTNPVQPDKTDISNWKVSGIKNLTYTGKVLKQKNIIVSNNGKYADFTTRYKNNLNVGTATVIITGTGEYTGSITKTFKILKAANPMTVKASAKTVKYTAVKKKAQTISAISVKKAVGAVSYKKTSGKSFLTVNAKTGKITVKKGTKKGTYTVKVKVTAKGNKNYNAGNKTVAVKITVK